MRSSLIPLAILAVVAGCGGRAGDVGVTSSFRDDVARLEQRTRPVGAVARRTLEPAIRSTAAEAAWVVKTQMLWPEYSLWVRRQLEPEFDIDTSVVRALRAVKGSPTDLYFLAIAPDSVDPNTVSVQFRALPR